MRAAALEKMKISDRVLEKEKIANFVFGITSNGLF